MITDLKLRPVLASASAFKSSGKDKPPMARPPMRRKSRRETPSQNLPWDLPERVSIGVPK
jgi:hypothetical protein